MAKISPKIINLVQFTQGKKIEIFLPIYSRILKTLKDLDKIHIKSLVAIPISILLEIFIVNRYYWGFIHPRKNTSLSFDISPRKKGAVDLKMKI